MKTVLMRMVMVSVAIASAHMGSAQAAPKAAKSECRLNLQDLKPIVGIGSTKDAAFEDAATQCFDQRRAAFEKKYGHNVSEDTGLLYIDLCANIRCG